MAAPKEKTNIITAIVYDFETGGLECSIHAATQISLHAVRLDTFEVMEKYSAYIYPYNRKNDLGKPKRKVLKDKYEINDGELMEYEKTAMDITNISMALLYKEGLPLEQVCQEICDFIKRNTFSVTAAHKPFMVGQNPLFDNGFMQQIMLYSGLWGDFCKLVRGTKDFWGNFQPAQLDTILLSQLTFGDDKSVTTWRLEAMGERLGIDLDDAHDADADVTCTREIVRVLTGRMRNANGSESSKGLFAERKDRVRDHFKI